MKKVTAAAMLLFALALCVPGALAELSSNLNIRQTFTRHGDVEKETFVDAQGNPVTAQDKGYCYLVNTYNKKPRVVRTEYFDETGALVNTAQGYAVIRQSWDGYGRLLSRAYFDALGNPVLCEDGYHMQKVTYSGKHTHMIEHFGVDVGI